MRIALVSTCAVTTPPRGYGGTELVVAELAKELVAAGQEVTVYATGDSDCAGNRRSIFPRPVWPPNDLAELRHTAFAWHDIARRGFDVVHVHHAMGIPFARFVDVPCVATLHHDRAASLVEHYRAYSDVAYVAISQRQADLAPELPFRRVIHHGLDTSLYPEGDGAGGYAVFLGRIAPEKAPHLAIDAAVQAGVALRVAGNVHIHDYHEHEVAPRLEQHRDLVRHVGEVVHAPKTELLRGALAMLFPIQWEEPFGLVMIESMLVGTPVIAFARGAVSEVVEDGLTGYVVEDLAEMAARLRDIRSFDRRRCRERARERFSSAHMCRSYLELYQELVRERQLARRPRVQSADAKLAPASGAGGQS